MSARLILAAALLVPALSACQRTGPLAPVTNVGQIPESAGGAVIVAQGDTLYTLSRRYNVPLRDLMEVNRLSPPYNIEPGQRLVLPASRQYVVQKGDTLYGISRMFNVEVTELSRLNSLSAPYAVKTGQPLRLPAGGQRTFETAEVAGSAETPATSGGPVPLTGPPPSKPPVRGGIQASELPPPGTSGAASAVASTASAAPSAAASVASASPKVAAVPLPPTPPAGGASPAGGEPGVAFQPGEAPKSLRPPGAKPAPPPADGMAPVAAPAAAPPPSAPPAAPQEVAAAAPPKAQPAPPPRGGARFLWPVKGKLLSPFGPKPDGMHNDGVNIAAPKGTPVIAADNGVVAYSGNELRGFGNLLLVRHADGWITAYAHLDRMEVERGASVKRGQVIGRVGQTGSVTSPQLHFEVRKGSHAVDPREHLDGSQQVSEGAFPAGRQGPG